MSDFNIVVAHFGHHNRVVMTDTLYQYDYGQKLKVEGITALPQTFQAHFSNVQHGGVSITVTGINGMVDVPNSLLMTGKRIYCWIYVTETGSGETVYQILMPVQSRPMPEYYDVEDVGVFDSVVNQVAGYAATATTGATSATASATAAAGSETAAAASASAAADSAENAAASETNAEASASAAQASDASAATAATTATAKAAEAAQSATSAGSAADRAEAAQEAAETAQTAAGNAASGAGQAAGAAGQYATSAGQSASRAETAASTAEGKASEATFAAGQAVEAETKAISAKNAAQVAESHATNAATTATAKATEAAASATAAAQAAASINTPDSALSDTSTNAVQNKVITGELTDVKTAIDNVSQDMYGEPTEEVQTLTANKYFNTTEVFRDGATTYSKGGYNGAGALSGTYCFYKLVSAGEKYEAVGVGSGTASVGFYILTDSERVIKASDKDGSRTTPTEIKVESDGYLYVNFYNYNSSTDYIKEIQYPESILEKLSAMDDKIDTIEAETVGTEITETLTLVANKFFNTIPVFYNGATTFDVTVPSDDNGTYCIKQVALAGEKYVLNGNTTGTNAIGFYVYTDAAGNVLSSQKVGTGTPTVVQITTDGYLYVNLRAYNAQTDYVQRKYADGGTINGVNALQMTLPFYMEKVVNFGDSIFGNKRPPNDVSTALAKLLNATVYNGGFGGCRMSQHSLTNFDPFCMYRLAYSIANNSWTLQDAAITNSNSLSNGDANKLPSYFAETLALLKGVDFTKVKAITIAYGTNDLTAAVRLDNQENPYDTTRFGGALRYSLETLMEAFPQLQVFVCCPTYRFWTNNGVFTEDSDTYTNSNGNTMAEMIELTKNIARAYHVKFIDNYYELGIDKFNRANWFPTGDSVHHNPKGAKLIAEHMANEMF